MCRIEASDVYKLLTNKCSCKKTCRQMELSLLQMLNVNIGHSVRNNARLFFSVNTRLLSFAPVGTPVTP